MEYDVYVDGSYKEFGAVKLYAGATLIVEKGGSEPLAALTKVGSDSYIDMRNVAGEIMATLMAFEHCLNVLHLTQADTVNLYYDYKGIENWCLPQSNPNHWRARNDLTQGYRDYVNTRVRTSFKVNFCHIKGHSGNPGNTCVDALAKRAIELHMNDLMRNT